MKTEGVALTFEDQGILKEKLQNFRKENKKRGIGLIIFFTIGALIVLIFGWDKSDFISTSFTMLGVFAVLLFAAYFIITKILEKKFTLDLDNNTKTVFEGKITGKNLNVELSKMINYEIDKESKVIKATTKRNDGATTFHRLRYDKDDSTGYLGLKKKLELLINEEPVTVDLKHFAEFDEGERVKAEQFTHSKQLIRVASLDHPEKIIETKTIKFK